MTYQVFIEPLARRQISKLPITVQESLLARITTLEQDPDCQAAKSLKAERTNIVFVRETIALFTRLKIQNSLSES